MKYDLISDSIRTELLGMTGNCTLSDVAYVKLHTSLYKDNKELGSLKENALKFFATLDKSPAYELEVHRALANYSSFLLSTNLTESNPGKNSWRSCMRKTAISARSSPISMNVHPSE